MILMVPFMMNDAYGRLFKHMANVWLEYNMFGFDTLKYRWDDKERRTGIINNMFQYTQSIQHKYGEQLIVLITMRDVDHPFDAYYGADIVIDYNTSSNTYRIMRNTFGEADSSVIYSSAQIGRVFNRLMWGDDGNN